MIYMVDIDDTICRLDTRDPTNYLLAEPIENRIQSMNKLYDNGNVIIYYTARGSGTGLDWEDVTYKQFQEWGVKYHDLKFGKPNYDIWVDDKACQCDIFFETLKTQLQQEK